ncbi:general transcription factor 3C polypeptide 2, partial [Austrofundulus limnaeus]|uniref:General transcription factor 3C polypeptide 2 n=1 Tax=Austrofundulus limnaeus TaxID=52670 RepID=A0A2I4CTG8_AUSLI
MDSIGSEEGQEEQSEQSLYSSVSSKGRQRKKNPKYLDYETADKDISESIKQELIKNGSEKKRAASQKGSKRGRKPKAAVQQAVDGDNETKEQTPSDSVGENVAATPKKPGRKKKIQPEAPVATDGGLPAEGDGGGAAERSVNQENGTPKPKRKYVKKKAAEPAEEPPLEEEPEEEVETGGRRRRGAAKMAMKYLQLLAKDVLSTSDEAETKLPAVSEQKDPKGRRGRKRKRLDSENPEDEDFVPDVEEEADEVEEDSEGKEESDDESDFESRKRSPAAFHFHKNHTPSSGKSVNGIDFSTVQTMWDSAQTTKKFREEHYSSWVFPEWVPSIKEWDPVPDSDLEKYLPQEPR